METIYEWAGCAAGIAGALLLAMRGKWAGVGFVAFLASNVLWGAYAIATEAYGLLAQQLVFSATSALGIYNWLVVPAKRRRELNIDPRKLRYRVARPRKRAGLARG